MNRVIKHDAIYTNVLRIDSSNYQHEFQTTEKIVVFKNKLKTELNVWILKKLDKVL